MYHLTRYTLVNCISMQTKLPRLNLVLKPCKQRTLLSGTCLQILIHCYIMLLIDTIACYTV
jgi:hypothetical protein